MIFTEHGVAVAMLRAGPSAWAGRVLTAGSERMGVPGRRPQQACERSHREGREDAVERINVRKVERLAHLQPAAVPG